MKCFLIFAKDFYAKFVPKITIRESFCQKFGDFLISRKFLFAKVSAPKVDVSDVTPANVKTFHHWFSLHIFVNVMKKEPPTKFYGALGHFSRTWKVPKF